MTKYGINRFVIIQKYSRRLIELSLLFMLDPKHDMRYQLSLDSRKEGKIISIQNPYL